MRRELITDTMIFVILVSLAVHVSAIGGSISQKAVFSGVVYASPGVPIFGASITASGLEGYGYTTTNPLGQYIIAEGLKTGNYTVSVQAEGFLDAAIENVSVTGGQETSGVDFLLKVSGGISGKVTDAVTGQPLQNVWVSAVPTDGGYAYGRSDFTDANGDYLIYTNLDTGTYNVSVSYQSGYIRKSVDGVAVTIGVETKGINLALNPSGIISGKVTDAVSGLPLQNIILTASATGSAYGDYAITDANGDYRMSTNLATGSYNVSALFPLGHVTKTVGPVAVTAGAETSGVNLALDPSGIISGMVTATPSGAPLEGASLAAFSSDYKYFGSAQTNATGHYRMEDGLGTGTYTVYASYDGAFDMVTGVSVTVGSETSGIDFALAVTPPPPSGRISGRVTDTTGDPISGALVTAEGPAGYGEDYTDTDGNYLISEGLGTGTYAVNASATGYLPQSISDVSVTVDQETPNINFQLTTIPTEQSGRISGTVQGESNPIPELQHPVVILMVVTIMGVVLVNIFNVKTRRGKPA